MEILLLSRDPHTPSSPIFGPFGHYGDPRIVQGSTYTKQPSVRVSMDSFETMEIPGLSRDPHTPFQPLSYMDSIDTMEIPGLSRD